MKKPIPGVNDVAESFEWIRENLNEDVVMAANWPHGTQLNVLGNVKTIVDSDHFLPHWIHLYYRHVFCAQDPYEALSFLKTHNATHLMLTEREVISRSHVYSYIGSNADNDRRFRLHKFVRVDAPIGEPFQLKPESNRMPIAFIDFVSKTVTRKLGTHRPVEIGKQQKLEFTIHLKTDENLTGEMTITLGKESTRTVSMGSSGLVFIFDRNGILKQGYLLSSRGWESLAIELFLRNKHEEFFTPIYPIENFKTSDVKIWKINYPASVKADPKYLVTDPMNSETDENSYVPNDHSHDIDEHLPKH